MLLRRIPGYPARGLGDPEQHIQLEDVVVTQAQTTQESIATGVELNMASLGLTHHSGGGRMRTWAVSKYDAEESVECDYCSRTFASDAALHDHYANKADHPYCKSCERIFDDERALQQHTRDAAAHQFRGRKVAEHPKATLYYCQTCDRNFKHKQALQQHREDSSMHQFCAQCDRQFNDWQAICRHLAASSCHDWCFACWRDLDNRNKLKRHCASHTRNEEQWECPMCYEQFDNPIAIGPHITKGCA
ncbi:hypothetical protein B0H12DRAFT_731863 [Mycena haematopus]|nr:hypothetical protein B0H12DRAFT_731863 [Mycena haematopus]